MVGDVEVDDLSPVMSQHDEDVEDAKRDRGDGEEIAGDDVGSVIGQGGSPGLRRRFSGADHVLGHRN